MDCDVLCLNIIKMYISAHFHSGASYRVELGRGIVLYGAV